MKHYETVTYWYGIQQPGLAADRRARRRQRSEREIARTTVRPMQPRRKHVESRHEVGVDQVPTMTDGETNGDCSPRSPTTAGARRRTPNSCSDSTRMRVGVMLRRRLDLAVSQPEGQHLRGRRGGREAGVGKGRHLVHGRRQHGRLRRSADGHSRARDSTQQVELHAAGTSPQTSNRRWREDEFLLPPQADARAATRFASAANSCPSANPLFPGHPPQEEAWTEFRYWAYCFVMPGHERVSAVGQKSQQGRRVADLAA